MDVTGSMRNLIDKCKSSVFKMFEQMSEILKEENIDPNLMLIQFAVYRNYDCTADRLLNYSGWFSDPFNLKTFMEGIKAGGGISEEAAEVGLQHAYYEATKDPAEPLSQVFLIADAPPNPVD